MVSSIPQGFHSLTPYLMVKDADKVVHFLKKAFDAREVSILKHPNGHIWHATLQVGDSKVMIGNTMGKHPDAPCSVYVYANDVDRLYRKAVEAGGQSIMEPADQFYGDRTGGIKDPAGNTWWLGTHIEDVSDDELKRRSIEQLNKWAA